MAPPPAYCLTNTLPKTMYSPVTTTADDSKIWYNSLYKPSPAQPTPSSAYTKVSWFGYANINTSFTNIFAYAFKPNHSELYPLAVATLNSDYNLTQDYGY